MRTWSPIKTFTLRTDELIFVRWLDLKIFSKLLQLSQPPFHPLSVESF